MAQNGSIVPVNRIMMSGRNDFTPIGTLGDESVSFKAVSASKAYGFDGFKLQGRSGVSAQRQLK